LSRAKDVSDPLKTGILLQTKVTQSKLTPIFEQN
jgi:hypothetical protein